MMLHIELKNGPMDGLVMRFNESPTAGHKIRVPMNLVEKDDGTTVPSYFAIYEMMETPKGWVALFTIREAADA